MILNNHQRCISYLRHRWYNELRRHLYVGYGARRGECDGSGQWIVKSHCMLLTLSDDCRQLDCGKDSRTSSTELNLIELVFASLFIGECNLSLTINE
jgi:hypothetical protein